MRIKLAVCWLAGGMLTAGALAQGNNLHYTYLWHLEQPIYWPDRQASGTDRYERVWESQQRKNAGGTHPTNNLQDIFALADRVAAYQYRPKDSVGSILWTSEGGAQVTYSGGLAENIQSLADNNAWGYSPSWASAFQTARGWTTNNGAAKPRMDIVQFSHHHALLPLCDDSAVRKELLLYKTMYPTLWGSNPGPSRGLFPSEMAFSTRLIPILQEVGISIDWAFVSAEKISRACPDFPVVYGSGGINCDPPNKADQINPNGVDFFRLNIDRGCSPAEAYPFSLIPRRARWVNPSDGTSKSIIIVPCSQSLGWKDGYAPIGTGYFGTLDQKKDATRPMLVVLAHDGDNAWGGGYSYYMESVPNLASSAVAQGYVPSTVERYLNDHPVPANDFVHVEDGAWVNADGDFGAPQFINWNWPLLNSAGKIDVENGWHEDARNWAVITAAQNRVDTAEQIWLAQGNALNMYSVLYPSGSTNAVERAWHYFLGSLNSGYMYYGTAEDFEVKPTLGCNNAVRLADPVIAAAGASGPTSDTTGPTIWYPQRHPWNPGSTNFGPQYGYQQQKNNGDFYVWTFAYDVSGIPAGSVVLKYRLDNDGVRSLSNTENETYAGGPGVGAWQSLTMTKRGFPAGNVYNNPTIDFYVMPTYIADEYWAKLTGIRSKLVDYYIEATDAKGNVKRSPIMHVYVGDGVGGVGPEPGATGGGGGGTGGCTIAPATPSAGQNVTVIYDPTNRPLASATSVKIHWGTNGWTGTSNPDPSMTLDNSVTPAVWKYTLTLPSTASALDVVFNNGSGTWDNNGGADWHFAVTGGVTPFVMDGNLDSGTTLAGTVAGAGELRVALRGDIFYIAAPVPTNNRDQFVYMSATPPGAVRAAQWAKGGQVAQWGAFIGAEVSNTYCGWFDAGTGVTTGIARGSVLEGTIDLRAKNAGTLPQYVYVATASYANPDGGALAPSTQIPAGNADANLDAAEWIKIPVCSLQSAGCVTKCNKADITDGSGSGSYDGQLTGSDVVSFFQDFFGSCTAPGAIPCNRADITDGSGQGAPEGQLTGSDVVVFFQQFFATCNP